MSRNYDNWERLVAAVLRREDYLELCRCPSLSSVASSDDMGSSSFRSFSSFTQDLPLDVSAPKDLRSSLNEKPSADSWAALNWHADRDGMVETWLFESGDAAVQRPIPRASQGELVAAGWPSWLSAVAGEAIRGWVPRKADTFEKLEKIGQGTHSNVYRGRDLLTGNYVALKKVKFDNLNPESVRRVSREICILRLLDHPNVIKLDGLVTSPTSSTLYFILEYMAHDLAGLASRPDVLFYESQIKCYMKQLLQGLDHCHSRGVLHRDIKCSDLLVNNRGILKIGDFGLATLYTPNRNQPLTSRVVTLWNRPPELFLGATNYSTAVDLWSTGCVLAELYAGKPIMHGRTEVEQLHKIFKLCGSPSEEYWGKYKLPHTKIFKPESPYKRLLAETLKDFPAPALALLDILLSMDPIDRGSAASALNSVFFTTRPYPSDPSDLPSYPPSKQYNIEECDREARRQPAAGSRGQNYIFENNGSRESLVVPVHGTNAQSNSSMHLMKRQGQSNYKSSNERLTGTLGRAQPSLMRSDQTKSEFDVLSCYGLKAKKNLYSGPPLAPSGKALEQKLKEHDRQIQEAVRRAQLDHVSKGSKIPYPGTLVTPSNLEQILKEHDRQIREVTRRIREVKATQKKLQVEESQLSGR